MNCIVNPSAGFNIVKTWNYNLELSVEFGVEVLDHFGVIGYFGSWNSFHYEFGGYFCLVVFYIFLSEQKLPIQIGYVNLVHIDNCNVFDSAECQIF